MASLISRLVPRRARSALRVRLAAAAREGIAPQLAELKAEVAAVRNSTAADRDSIRQDLADLRAITEELREQSADIKDISSAVFDRTPELRRRLLRIRDDPSYAAPFETPEPLITVRIATYDRADILVERTIPSVLAQTYPHFELIIVGDGCDESTAQRLSEVQDPRVEFVNLPHRSRYPDDPQMRWLVAGSPAMNVAGRLARGLWIAPLDDDDEFLPTHLEVLLDTAVKGRFEMVYGKFQSTLFPEYSSIGEYPPRHGHFTFQAAMYMTLLRDAFEYETNSWVLEEPGDWNLCRRMMDAGVRIGWTEETVTVLHPAGPS